jgi:hypothetical protein
LKSTTRSQSREIASSFFSSLDKTPRLAILRKCY